MFVVRLAIAFTILLPAMVGWAEASTRQTAEPTSVLFDRVSLPTRVDQNCHDDSPWMGSRLSSVEPSWQDDEVELPGESEDGDSDDLGEAMSRGGRPAPPSAGVISLSPLVPASPPRSHLLGGGKILPNRSRFLGLCRLLI